jgi:hypothetical protein
MPFQSQGLGATLTDQLNAFIANNNFPELYLAYAWRNDTYANGFPDIFSLENEISYQDQVTGITIAGVRMVCAWGRLRNPDRVQGPNVVLPANALNSNVGGPQPNLQNNPSAPIVALANLNGIGPTYQSKVLRFGLAQEFGAIDTRCVRVFGQGDPLVQQHAWLQLMARRSTQNNGRLGGWYIAETQASWTGEYATWINILRYFANLLPNNCPHPNNFTNAGLRANGAWTCADVEMALFTYASAHVP